MELYMVVGLPIVLLFGLTILLMLDGILTWVKRFKSNSSTLWNFGIVSMSSITVVNYPTKR